MEAYYAVYFHSDSRNFFQTTSSNEDMSQQHFPQVCAQQKEWSPCTATPTTHSHAPRALHTLGCCSPAQTDTSAPASTIILLKASFTSSKVW